MSAACLPTGSRPGLLPRAMSVSVVQPQLGFLLLSLNHVEYHCSSTGSWAAKCGHFYVQRLSCHMGKVDLSGLCCH